MKLKIKASDAKSKIHLKCGDTDEVRPSDFTRYSTQKQVFTPYIVEMQTTTPETTPDVDKQQQQQVDYNESYETWANGFTNEKNENINNNYYEYNRFDNNAEHYQNNKNKEQLNQFVTSPHRPVTNTYNLLNRKSSKSTSIFSTN